MKIDRLLGITIYLLNHNRTTAQRLADRFEVSVRTIIRDIDTLCMAGIPVVSSYGVDGGYEILDTFKMEKQVAGENDYKYIISALEGFASAYDSKEIRSTLEKIELVSGGNPSDVVLDFGVLHENETINDKLSVLNRGIKERKIVQFDYTNERNIKKKFRVEAVATMYKWYSWYLIGYYSKYDDYCIFKLVRMENLSITDTENSKIHNVSEVKEMLNNKKDNREYIKIKIYCCSEIKIKCQEYLNGVIEESFDNGDIIFSINVPKDEQFWFGTLISFGNKVKVLEPKEISDKICDICVEILKNYDRELS